MALIKAGPLCRQNWVTGGCTRERGNARERLLVLLSRAEAVVDGRNAFTAETVMASTATVQAW